MNRLVGAAGLLAGVGGASFAYGALVEPHRFVLRQVTARCLPVGSDPLRVLHISDLHLTPGQERKRRWVVGLADLEPDLVINTGDNLSAPVVEEVLETYRGLLSIPGAFVFGSNDYLAPVWRNPLRYLARSTAHELPVDAAQRELPWRPMRDAFTGAGWLDLTNASADLTVRGVPIHLRGVDDPHIDQDDYASVAGPADHSRLELGVVHAPYQRVLDRFAEDQVDLIFSGHTHGGQVCVPGFGAIVTNCDIDRARVKGLSTHSSPSWTSLLNVSAGLGMSRYAPYRFACRPEATLLTLVPR